MNMLSQEEIQLEKILQQAIKEYGEIKKKVDELKKSLSPTAPRLTPDGARGIDEKSERIRQQITLLEKEQKEIKDAVYNKADNICKDSSPEIKEKVTEKVDDWQKSDIEAKYLEQEKKVETIKDFKQNTDEIISTDAQKRQKQIDELRQKFAQNKELYKERDR